MMTRKRHKNNNHQGPPQHQSQEYTDGPPPGLENIPHFQNELTGDPVRDFALDFAPPGLSHQSIQPSCGMPPASPFHPRRIHQSMQSLQLEEPLASKEPSSSMLPRNPPKQRKKKNRKPKENSPEGPTEECILCCQRADIFGTGQCRHPACIECVIRMRCLGESKVCHVCRENIQTMQIVQKPPKWEDYVLPECSVPHPDCEKFDIAFETQHTVDVYNKLNAFVCNICSRADKFAEFPSFPALRQHMGTEHNLYFCHICLDHLNILPKNRQTFQSNELDKHMKGRRNIVRGVRGHPECGFCHQRFFDDEELYRHSRKEHFYCSICAEYEGLNSFFKTIKNLHDHYKQKHHPCLDQDCVELGIAFVDEFALNVHKAERHGGADRTIPISFQFSRGERYAGSRSTNQSHQGISLVSSNHPPLPQPTNTIPSAQQTSGRNVQLVNRPIIVQQHDFPALPTRDTPRGHDQGSPWMAEVFTNRRGTAPQAKRQLEPNLREQLSSTSYFPSLDGPTSSSNKKALGRNTVWSSGKTMDIMKKPPPEPKPRLPSPKRKKIIPLPEVWPENMRRKLEARKLGLPEPEDLEPPLPQPPLDGKPKRPKKPKKKGIGLEALKKKLNEQPSVINTSSKFDVLVSETD